MAAYINHAQMAYETYNKIKEEQLLKTEIDSKIMTTFAHGIDLSGYNELTHNKKTQEFLLNFMKKVKSEKQIENPQIMAMLYGHICHYFLDTQIHPYIYYLEKGTKSVRGQFISGHLLIESYLSSYFLKTRMNEFIMDFQINRFFTLAPKECRKMLDVLYLETYNLKNISKNYQRILAILLVGEIVLKNTPLKNQNFCEIVVRFRKYLEYNNLTVSEIVNESHHTWLHPVTGKVLISSVTDLYNESIEKAIEAINELNKYFYGNKDLNSLKNYFPNISYDTGINLDDNQIMTFCRKK